MENVNVKKDLKKIKAKFANNAIITKEDVISNVLKTPKYFKAN